jgi:DNA-binding beta-propeller fold protein YncE
MTSPRIRLLLLFYAFVSTALGQSTADWDYVRTSYGNLTWVAGRAWDRNLNSWSSDFEGGSALTAELSNPHMAIADATGNIYIADKESHSILKVTPAGTIHTVAGTHLPGDGSDGPATQCELSNPNGCYVLADGTLYVLDLDNRKIRRVGTNGEVTTILQVPDGFRAGRGLWVSPDEQVIYFCAFESSTASMIKRWTPSGGMVNFSTGYSILGNITVDQNGALVVTEDSGNRVFRLDGNGMRTLIAGKEDGSAFGGGDGLPATSTGLDRVRGVAFLPTGGFFLATQKGSHIWYVDTGGIIHKMMDCWTSASPVYNEGNGELYSTPGIKMNEPRAITVAPNGDLIITASDHGQIRVVKCIRPPLPPVSLRLDNSASLRLRWNGIPWQSYFIDYSPTMSPPAWQTIGIRTSVPGLESLHPLPDQGNSLQGFFRVRAPR